MRKLHLLAATIAVLTMPSLAFANATGLPDGRTGVPSSLGSGTADPGASTGGATVQNDSIVCPEDTEHAQRLKNYKQQIKAQIAPQLDMTVNIETSPFIYYNKDAGCDLGFSMPGLPDIGFGLDGIDACQVLKAVTGDMVKAVNDQMQDAVDGAINDITGGDDDLDFNIDLGDMALEEINNGG